MKEIMPQKACCSQTPKSFTQHEHLKWLTHTDKTRNDNNLQGSVQQETEKGPCRESMLRATTSAAACSAWRKVPQ
jgi:hypothetical protein